MTIIAPTIRTIVQPSSQQTVRVVIRRADGNLPPLTMMDNISQSIVGSTERRGTNVPNVIPLPVIFQRLAALIAMNIITQLRLRINTAECQIIHIQVLVVSPVIQMALKIN